MALEAQQSNFGLKNAGKFTRSHCDCDQEFYQCLKKVNTLVSNQIGLIYFNILGGQCFREEHPVKCKKHFRGRCVSYDKDESQSKKFQWFDNKWY
jgi:secretory phospholipase A2